MLRDRTKRYLALSESNTSPDFNPQTASIRDGDWEVDPLPARLLDQRVYLGDVSPSNTTHFINSLTSQAQAVQVSESCIDFICPIRPFL